MAALTSRSLKSLLPVGVVDELKGIIESYDRIRQNTESWGSKTKSPGTDAEIEILRTRLQTPPVLTWMDLMQAELCIADVLDEQSLRARLLGWRRRMQEVVGETRYQRYSDAAPDPRTAPYDQIYADIAECVRTVYYFYGAYRVGALSRSRLTMTTFKVALAILAVLGIQALLLDHHGPYLAWLPSFSPSVILTGEWLLATSAAAVCGSVVSVQTRLQDPAVDVDPFYRFIQTESDSLSIAYVAPIFAAIFGFLIFGLMASGLTGGNAFPHLDQLLRGNMQFADVALLLIYGFIAGFAERLVPDALTRIATKTLDSIAGSDLPPAPKGQAQAAALQVNPTSLALTVGQTVQLVATLKGRTVSIVATAADPGIVDISAPSITQGLATFTVTGKAAGSTIINVALGAESAAISAVVA